jgi:hypothetical protein
MAQGSCCSVCGASDARALIDVVLLGGAHTTLCGTHALMHRRSGGAATTAAELRRSLRDRRGSSDRREDGDELGVALTSAFQPDRRGVERRGAGR